MKASEMMTRDPRTCEPNHDLSCAIRIMQEEDTGIVPVTEGNGEARVVGVVTDRDVALALGERDAAPSDCSVGDVMKTDVVSVSPDADVRDVSRRMQEAQVRRILVVEDGRLVGIISTADLARASAHKDGRLGEEVESVIEKVSEESGSARSHS
jgi:CBS domain-containing protein